MKFLNKNIIPLALACLVVCTAVLTFFDIRIERLTSPEHATQEVYSQIESIAQKHEAIKNYLTANPLGDSLPDNSENTIIHIYKGDTLCKWNSNLADSRPLCGLPDSDSIVSLGSGVFYSTFFQTETYNIVLLDLLFQNAEIQNQHIRNGFVPSHLYGNYSFELKDGAVSVTPEKSVEQTDSFIILLLVVMAIAMLFVVAFNIIKKHSQKPWIVALTLVITAAILLFLILLHHSAIIFSSELYSKTLVLSTHGFSFGVLTEALVCITALSIIIYKILYGHDSKMPLLARSAIAICITAGVYCAFVVFSASVCSSGMTFVTDSLTGFNAYEFLLLWLIGIAAINAVIILYAVIGFFMKPDDKMLPAILFALAVATAFTLLSNHYVESAAGFALAAFCLMRSCGKLSRGLSSTFVLIVLAFVMTFLFKTAERQRKETEMKVLAQDIADERDFAFEADFEAIEPLISNDSLIRVWLGGDFVSDDSLLSYIDKKYFTENIRRFDFVATVCHQNQELIIEPKSIVVDCNSHFRAIVSERPHKKISDRLTSVDFPSPESYYIADFGFTAGSVTTHLYIEFIETSVWDKINTPSIFIDEGNLFINTLQKYSFACYINNILVYKNGAFLYPNFRSDMADDGFFNGRRFMHYGCTLDGYKSVVVSCERPGTMRDIAPFSYFLIILLIVFLLIFKLILNSKPTSPTDSLQYRMQTAIVLTLFVSLMAIGPVSVIFIRNGYERTSNEIHFKNTRSIMTSLQGEISPDLTMDSGAIDNLLEEYSIIFSADVNLYDTNGALISTSRHDIFDLGLSAPQINAEAYDNIHRNKKLYYFHRESIGDRSFPVAYIPLSDENGDAFAYLSLPNYSIQSELENEIVSFMFSYVNIMLLFMGLSVIVVLIFSRRITKPLQLIQERMKDVRIDKPNQQIEWKSRDEIGQLVRQYNILVAELEKSAGALARSERETAWRDMARQVAHEIKNPLTPMRLSIQLLQRAWQENDPNLEQQFNKTSALLIEQIDSLSAIASAFSDYAKLPQNTIERFNLAFLVRNTATLYDNNANITFGFNFSTDADFDINSDRNNLGRALGNIIKNAVQAIGDKPDGHIEISIERKGSNYEISVSDNGCGIDESKKKSVFLPNFTTKSSGMGVGLSITRNIIESLGGTIDFESEVGKGTTFRLVVPTGEKDNNQ